MAMQFVIENTNIPNKPNQMKKNWLKSIPNKNSGKSE